MPQINRCRIINFSYNNNFRNILDETFDFYQGESALLNLKNGGGKSVLVQVMLQPIIPKVRLMGRKIDDFFKGKKTPAYILIEWKLEDKGGYLLTGIALTNRESQSREQDEESNSIKYFTFTNHYRESNLFDIEHIPLVKKEGEKLYIEDFKDAKKLFSAKDKTKDLNVQVFTDEAEERDKYRKVLESFNIFRDEWDSIILKINESEGGVIEIFERCKTSQQLMNDWILKSVEKVVNNDDNDQKKLELMLENLVEEMISNEQYIYEKEVYGKFNIDLDGFISKLNNFVISLDKEKSVENEISRLYYYLKNETNKIQNEISKLSESIAASQVELKKIEIEERSKEYYDQLVVVEKLEKQSDEEKEKLGKIKDKISVINNEVMIQKAARDYAYIKRLISSIAGINEEIDRIKNNSDNKEKIMNLEYSLKIAYENLLKKLNDEAIEIQNKRTDLHKQLTECESKITVIDSKINSNQNLLGEVSAYIKGFEDEEPKMKLSLGFNFDRNLYGEIEKEFIDSHSVSLEKKVADLVKEKESLTSDIIKQNENNNNIIEQVTRLRAEEIEKIKESSNLSNKIKEYYKLEDLIKEVFRKHKFDYNKRFNFEENKILISNRINDLQKTEREIDFYKKTINDKITSLKEGTFHVSKEFRQWLINNNIDFETGENYLRKQEENIRNKLINQNPMLPYAFILYEDDIKKLKSMGLNININQIVPILTYGDINESYIVKGKEVEINAKLHVICLYDNKMINAENLEFYMSGLINELEEVRETLDHYSNELKAARDDSYVIMQFNFDINYIYALESAGNKLYEEITSIKNKIAKFENIKEENIKNIECYRASIIRIEITLDKFRDKKNQFIEFLDKDRVYLNNKSLYKEYSESIKKYGNEKELVNEQKAILTKIEKDLLIEHQKINTRINDKENKYQVYRSVQEGMLVEDTIENMEERLHALTNEITTDLNKLEKELNNKSYELSERNDNLKTFNLKENQYIDVIFDKIKLEQLQNDAYHVKNKEKEQDDICRKAESRFNLEQGKLYSVEKELKKLTPSPIEPELIKLNFEGRRKAENSNIYNSNETIKKLNLLSVEYSSVTNRIENRIAIENFQVNTDYVIKTSVIQDFKKIDIDLKNIHEENEKHDKNINNQYNKIKTEYKDKNKNIENIFMGLDPLVDGAADDKNKYYYLGERILYSSESLKKLIEACDLRLNNLEKNKKDMVQHSFLHGIQVYDEILKIADNSSIQIDGKSKHMMKIEMVPLEESDDDNINKMKTYIEVCVNIIKQDMKENKKTEEIRKKISKYMSTRELLNVLSDLGKMVVKAYKIDINEKNSKYKTWEQVMKENSGGERFVSFFAVLIALMSYTRTSMKFSDDYERNKDTKVLVMDNPFGPISSEHLLKPLFNIAKKYNTQLICLTDLKQNSIMNCFNLIYMIKIRQNVLGTSEYLQLEKQINNESLVERDEKLEKAVFKAQEVEQIRLF